MTHCYQNQCEDICYSPCNYRTVYSYRTYDCGVPCGYRGYRDLCSYRDCYPSYSSRHCYPSYSSRHCYPSYSSRHCYPYSSYYTRRYSHGSCYPC